MNFTNVATWITQYTPYALGRFYFIRRCYSFLRKNFSLNTQLVTQQQDTLFPTINIEKSVMDLKNNAVTFGFQLPENCIQEIHQFAKTEKCIRGGDSKEFLFSEVQHGKLSDNNSVVLGFVKDPLRCDTVKRITTDERLLAVCSRYLGYRPKKIETRLYWSFVTDETDEMRREKWQTTRYHFDVDGFNFIYVNLYITPVTCYSGAHVMIKNSHRKKPLRMLFHSAIQTDEAILKRYGQENEMTIEGPAGFGFIQDSSCYHKALAPISDHRLMLQLRIK